MINELEMGKNYWYSAPYKNNVTQEIQYNPEMVKIFEDKKENFKTGKITYTKRILGFFWKGKLEDTLKYLEKLGLDYKRCFEEIKNPEF